jgi:hypothetical protein
MTLLDAQDCADGFVLSSGRLILGWTVEKMSLQQASRIAAKVEGQSSFLPPGIFRRTRDMATIQADRFTVSGANRGTTMPSPFPGMNPYLEQDDVWHDFHERFLPHLAEVIGTQLAAHYIVKIDEHVYIHEPPAEQRTFLGRTDVFVASQRPSAEEGTATATAPPNAPAQVVLPSVDIEGISYLEIRDRRDRRLVTVIELLSPTNKYSGPDREQYLGKRGRLLASAVHLVEIDLLRGGPRMPFAASIPECAYYVLVSRMEKRPRADFWPIPLRDPLPLIPIPLRDPDPDAKVDLQAVLHHIYDAARYGNYIYEGTPQPGLRAEDATWVRQFVPAQS